MVGEFLMSDSIAIRTTKVTAIVIVSIMMIDDSFREKEEKWMIDVGVQNMPRVRVSTGDILRSQETMDYGL
jgi:hypothetical protein